MDDRWDMLWSIFLILLVLWMLGFGFHVAGGLIHLLLVVAVVVLVYNLIAGRRSISGNTTLRQKLGASGAAVVFIQRHFNPIPNYL